MSGTGDTGQGQSCRPLGHLVEDLGRDRLRSTTTPRVPKVRVLVVAVLPTDVSRVRMRVGRSRPPQLGCARVVRLRARTASSSRAPSTTSRPRERLDRDVLRVARGGRRAATAITATSGRGAPPTGPEKAAVLYQRRRHAVEFSGHHFLAGCVGLSLPRIYCWKNGPVPGTGCPPLMLKGTSVVS